MEGNKMVQCVKCSVKIDFANVWLWYDAPNAQLIKPLCFDCYTKVGTAATVAAQMALPLDAWDLPEVPIPNPPTELLRCACGVDKVGGRHTDYCPKYNPEEWR
jgi:hypothetical protein